MENLTLSRLIGEENEKKTALNLSIQLLHSITKSSNSVSISRIPATINEICQIILA